MHALKLGAICAAFATNQASQAALIPIGEAFLFDPDSNVTWVRDANFATQSPFGIPTKAESDGTHIFGIRPDGAMNFETATAWISAMNSANFGGYGDWRLPVTLQPDPTCTAQGSRSSGFNCSGGEMGHLYYDELKNSLAVVDPSNHNLITFEFPPKSGDFQNLQPRPYWSSTSFEPDQSQFFFSFYNGQQGDYQGQFADMHALAVRDGRVLTSVPITGTLWALLPVFAFLPRRQIPFP